MQTLLNDLVQVLVRELGLYDQVLGLLEEEHAALLARTPQEVLGAVRRKETALLQIRTLEESRQLICRRLADGWKVPPAGLTLLEMARRCGPPLDGRLLELRGQLTDQMAHLSRVNASNGQLCRQGMESVRRILHAVAGEGVEAAYARPGTAPAAAGGRMHWKT